MADKKRMIYADTLYEELSTLSMMVTGLRAGKGVLNEFMKQYRESVLRVVDEQPTVDAVEVVHGRWEFSHTTTVEKFAVVKCSNCGREAFAIANYVKEGHYCPNCGAKMDGDGNE